MRQRSVRRALLGESIEIVCHAALGQRRAVDNDNDAIDGDAAPDRRPMERLHQRLRQRQARRFDDNVLDAVSGKNRIERGHEFVGDGAAQTAIGQFDDVLLGTRGVAATFQDLAVNADIAELIDNDGEPAARRVGDDVANERGFAGAEKAGDDGAGNARKRRVHKSVS